jgi:hypothetical protein
MELTIVLAVAFLLVLGLFMWLTIHLIQRLTEVSSQWSEQLNAERARSLQIAREKDALWQSHKGTSVWLPPEAAQETIVVDLPVLVEETIASFEGDSAREEYTQAARDYAVQNPSAAPEDVVEYLLREV